MAKGDILLNLNTDFHKSYTCPEHLCLINSMAISQAYPLGNTYPVSLP